MPRARDEWLDKMSDLWGLYVPRQDGASPFSIFAKLRKVYGEDLPLAALQQLALRPPNLNPNDPRAKLAKHADPYVAYFLAVCTQTRERWAEKRTDAEGDPLQDLWDSLR